MSNMRRYLEVFLDNVDAEYPGDRFEIPADKFENGILSLIDQPLLDDDLLRLGLVFGFLAVSARLRDLNKQVSLDSDGIYKAIEQEVYKAVYERMCEDPWAIEHGVEAAMATHLYLKEKEVN
jgi:hypothetical protein